MNIKTKMIFMSIVIAAMTVLFCSIAVFADDTIYTEGTIKYTIGDESITVIGCFGKKEEITVPASIAGYPVNVIASGAFASNYYLDTLKLPDTIIKIEEGAIASWVKVIYNSNTEYPSLVPPEILTGHQWDSGKVTTEPTCTKPGIRTYTCSICRSTKTEEIQPVGHTEEVLPAVEPTETEPGLTKGKKCSVCGAILVAQYVVNATGENIGEGDGDIDDNDSVPEENKPEIQPAREANTIAVNNKKKTFKRKKLKKKKTFTITVRNAQGKVTYSLNKAAKKAKIKVAATKGGKYKITVPKKCKKGKYIITFTASGDKTHEVGSKTVTIVVK